MRVLTEGCKHGAKLNGRFRSTSYVMFGEATTSDEDKKKSERNGRQEGRRREKKEESRPEKERRVGV